MNRPGSGQDELPRPVGAERLRVIAEFLAGLVQAAPLRQTCRGENVKRVVACWDEAKGRLYRGESVDQVVRSLWTDVRVCGGVPVAPDLRFTDVACALAESLWCVGRTDESRALLDAALSEPAGSVRDSTRRRLEQLGVSGSPGGGGNIVAGGLDEDVLRALPASKYEAISSKLKRGVDAVKRAMGKLRAAGLVEGRRGAGHKRTKEGDALLERWSVAELGDGATGSTPQPRPGARGARANERSE